MIVVPSPPLDLAVKRLTAQTVLSTLRAHQVVVMQHVMVARIVQQKLLVDVKGVRFVSKPLVIM